MVLLAMLTAPLAAYAAYVSPPAVLMILVGLAAVFALVTAGARGLSRMLRGRAGGLVAGGFAGFLNVTSGLSGPPLVAYAESIRWHPQRFVASLQLVFVAYNLITLGWRGAPETGWSAVLALALATAAGVLVGAVASRRVRPAQARVAMLTIAWAGALIVLGRGLLGLFGIG